MAVAAAVLLGVLAYDRWQIQSRGQRGPAPSQTEHQAPDVSVIDVEPASYRARLTGYGAAQPRYSLALTAQVSGRVTALDDGFASGERVARGTALVTLEDSDYAAALAEARYNLASARQALLEARQEQRQARQEWQASGLSGEPDSPLVLHGPQVATAQAAADNAEAAMASAQKDLDQTRIAAPFDALVVERDVAPGSYVQAGDTLATLYSTDRVEVTVSLPQRDWQQLPDAAILTRGDWPVTLRDDQTGQQWQGRVVRVERHLDDTTRQRALVVAVDQPLDRSPALLPGNFLEVRLAGREVAGLWKLPASALSQRGKLWYVTADGTLADVDAEPAFRDGNAIYVPVPDDLTDRHQRVLTHPLSSYLAGMAVNAVRPDAPDGSAALADAGTPASEGGDDE
ncbi:efflux RND transporter periplasmic adaptor subunit [Halomonas coralii]|nr:efflux RND transporter periplasmic adaptor subunit [Modicisalibacter sp. R2A 31.J]MBZ9575029.1 efflux RND transporter periplasmic adaptor subunit [Modicisalibacter sp. MOD 31.J]